MHQVSLTRVHGVAYGVSENRHALVVLRFTPLLFKKAVIHK